MKVVQKGSGTVGTNDHSTSTSRVRKNPLEVLRKYWLIIICGPIVITYYKADFILKLAGYSQPASPQVPVAPPGIIPAPSQHSPRPGAIQLASNISPPGQSPVRLSAAASVLQFALFNIGHEYGDLTGDTHSGYRDQSHIIEIYRRGLEACMVDGDRVSPKAIAALVEVEALLLDSSKPEADVAKKKSSAIRALKSAQDELNKNDGQYTFDERFMLELSKNDIEASLASLEAIVESFPDDLSDQEKAIEKACLASRKAWACIMFRYQSYAEGVHNQAKRYCELQAKVVSLTEGLEARMPEHQTTIARYLSSNRVRLSTAQELLQSRSIEAAVALLP